MPFDDLFEYPAINIFFLFDFDIFNLHCHPLAKRELTENGVTFLASS